MQRDDCVVDDGKEKSYKGEKEAALSMARPERQSAREVACTLPET